MFALFAFGALFGFMGLLLAVPLAAATGVLLCRKSGTPTIKTATPPQAARWYGSHDDPSEARSKSKWENPEAERLLSTAGGQFEGEYQMGDV